MTPDPTPKHNDDTKAILARRRFLIQSTLAGLGVAATAAVTGCDEPKPCLKVKPEPKACLKEVPPQKKEEDPQPCLEPPKRKVEPVPDICLKPLPPEAKKEEPAYEVCLTLIHVPEADVVDPEPDIGPGQSLLEME